VLLFTLTIILIGMLNVALETSLTQASNNNVIVFQKGMSYATYAFKNRPDQYERPESDKSLESMKKVGIEWVALNVIWYQDKYNSTTIYPNETEYSPTNESVVHAINKIHELEMKVMLKPMIDVSKETDPDPWRGKIQPSTAWFQSYANFINFFATLANQTNVEMLCIGTELNRTASWEPEWRNIISGVRQRYSRPLTYAAIWWKEFDEYVKWWDALDYVGIDAYFPLSNKSDPTITEMKETLESISNYLNLFYTKVTKPIIFTEIGYLSANGTNIEPWNYHLMDTNELDLQEQADCYEAALQALWNRTWLNGTYWWYWQTSPDAGGSNNKDYTPQNKPAQGVLTHWYSVIPEFPSALILPLFMIATLLAVIVYRRKRFQ
jgi:hypothetical protein